MNIFADFLPDFLQFNSISGSSSILLLGIIMFLGAIGGRLFQKLKIPQVVGYIVIGILIGQSGFQVLSKNVITSLEPLSSIALSFIGFLIGAELKTSVIKKYGKQFVGILLFEAIVPFFVVSFLVTLVSYLVTHDMATSLSLGLVLGSISSATAPAATTDVLKENRTKGPLTTTVLGIVAMDDAVALILYAVASSIASSLLGLSGGSLLKSLLMFVHEVFGSMVLGSCFGFLLSIIIKNIMTDEGRILSFSLGALLLSTGLSAFVDFDNILCAMSMGFFMVNFASKKTQGVFSLVEKFTPPIYVLFFVLVGAKLNVWNVTFFVGIIALLYVVCRTLGKSIGAKLGAKLTKAPLTVYKYLPFCLLSQAGVAIGLSIAAGNDFSTTIGPTVMLIITATTFVVQLLGPVCVKYGVEKAGECNLDIDEDAIIKKCFVKDVEFCGKKICRIDSPYTVSETESLKNILSRFSNQENLNYAVKDDKGKLSGFISVEHLKESLLVSDFAESLLAMDIMEPFTVSCSPDNSIIEIKKLFSDYDVDAIPVMDKDGNALGMLEKNTLDHFIHRKILEVHQKIESLG